MRWRKKWREHADFLANDYRDTTLKSWVGDTVLAMVVSAVLLGGAMVLLDWAFQDERRLLRSIFLGATAALGHAGGRRFFGRLAFRRRARRQSAFRSATCPAYGRTSQTRGDD